MELKIVKDSVEVRTPADLTRLVHERRAAGASQVLVFDEHFDLHDQGEAEEVEKAGTSDGGPGTGSKQVPDETEHQKLFRESRNQIVVPEEDPDVWAEAPDLSTRLRKSISLYARNVLGRGVSLVLREEYDKRGAEPGTEAPEEGEGLEQEIAAEYDRVWRLLDRPNPDMPFNRMMELIGVDYEATGNGYKEVVPDIQTNEVAELYHAQSRTIRVLKGGRGFIQIRDGEKRYFKHLGDTRLMDGRTGLYEHEAGFPVDGLKPEDMASEMMHFKLYTTKSTSYGAPRYVAAAPAISGNRNAAIYNVTFFKNGATPRFLIVVSGGRLDTESVLELRKMLRTQHKGADNAHRTAVLQAEPHGADLAGSSATKIEVVPLTVGKMDDASFQEYRRGNDEEIREAFGINKVYFTTDDVNRASADTGRRITEEEEFEPERQTFEHVLNCRLGQRLGMKYHWIKLGRPVMSDPTIVTEVTTKQSANAHLTVNEARRRYGMEPFPKDAVHAWADLPWPLVLARVQYLGFDPFKPFSEPVTPKPGRARNPDQDQAPEDEAGPPTDDAGDEEPDPGANGA